MKTIIISAGVAALVLGTASLGRADDSASSPPAYTRQASGTAAAARSASHGQAATHPVR